MKLQLGKFEVREDGDNVEIKVSTVAGSSFQAASVDLTHIEAVKLRNWLNNFLNGNDTN